MPANVRIKTAKLISELAKEMELKDILDFWNSSFPGERVGAAIGICTHLTIYDNNQSDKIVINTLQEGLSDSYSRVRYRVVEAIGKSEKLVNHFKEKLTPISHHDKNSGVGNKAKEILKKYQA